MSENSPHFLHQAFGLTFASVLPMPELLSAPAGAPVDVEIVFGAVPAELPGVLKRGVRFQSAANALRFQIDGVAAYLIEGGRRITIAPFPGVAEEEVRLFLLGSAMGALLHQRGDLVLHASAIEWNGEAAVFVGQSGMGKSTLATAFRRQGRAVLTDDLCVVRPREDGRMMAQPGFPQAKLWLDSLKRLEFEPAELRKIRACLEKRALPLEEGFHRNALSVRKIYLLGTHNVDRFDLIPGAGPQKFNVLKNHTYRFLYIADTGTKAVHFKHAMQLAQQVPLARVVRPMAGFRIDELIELIEADLRT